MIYEKILKEKQRLEKRVQDLQSQMALFLISNLLNFFNNQVDFL